MSFCRLATDTQFDIVIMDGEGRFIPDSLRVDVKSLITLHLLIELR